VYTVSCVLTTFNKDDDDADDGYEIQVQLLVMGSPLQSFQFAKVEKRDELCQQSE